MGRRVEAHGGADENATEGFVQPGIRGCYIGCPGSCRDWPRGETVRSLASNRREPHGFCIHRSSGACRQPALPCSFRGSNRSEERRVGKECAVRVDLGGRRHIKNTKLYIIALMSLLTSNHQYEY